MAKAYFKQCENDEEYAKASLFLLKHRRDLHPAYTTMDTLSLLYSYLTEGQLVIGLDEQHQVNSISAYYYGTPEQDFQNKEVVFVDMVIVEQMHRGTRLFAEGLNFLVHKVLENRPEVQELSLAALSENKRLCRMYSKFVEEKYKREGALGEETVFGGEIRKIGTMLRKTNPV
ncbi:hypothetical protein [Paenibacillus algorifonticola]|uniref:hypothetical protein n=1 Tax=Paenibacillus algorifonticola TaxID=684063 RepID=UPI0006198369|nr:hypothetical protein [Paenibacillus algorifonticola]